MKSFIALLVVLIVVSSAEAGKRSSNIVGGQIANNGQFPFMASLTICGSSCGGFIISPYHIGTAAHCFDNATLASCITAQVGTSDISGTAGQIINASSFVVNPNFDDVNLHNDAAIITLASPINIDGTNTKVATLATSSSQLPANGTTVYTAGWGLQSTNGTASLVLLYVDLPYINLAQCNQTYNDLATGLQVCAGGDAGKDSCQGDSGGPLFTTSDPVNPTDAVLIGIVSFGGNACAVAGVPGVYSDIPNFANPFFQSVINTSTSQAPSTLVASVNASSLAGSSIAGSSAVAPSQSGAASSIDASSAVVALSQSGAASSVAASSVAPVLSQSGAASSVAASSVAPVLSQSGAASSVDASSVVAASSVGVSNSGSKSQSRTPSNTKPVTAASSGAVASSGALSSGAVNSAAASPSITQSKVKAAKTKTGLAAITCRSDCLRTFRSCKKTTRRLRTCKRAKKACVKECGVVNPNK